ncbi:MAG: Phenolphthiocerol synthesis polyketide synthase type I Pks15/1 [Marine Group II euryarchaeote MED-G33]|nr:MAG: Phenolphthiocerol synthesis polyketide synthase type I Pks15/1 [Marine Group II euryarchaeote MED-G33]
MTTLDENPQDPFEPIAVIGIATLLPDAPDVDSFWQNILSAKVSLKEVPNGRWNPSDFWAEGGPKNVDENKTYSKIGGWIEDYEFDWRRWKTPPGSLPQIDLTQQWAVTVSAAALEDAGYMGEGARELPKARTGVIFANALGGENRNLSNHRIWADHFARHAVEAGGMPSEGKTAFKQAILEGLPRVTEDTMPGELANVVSGRVANLLDLQGPNYSTDAACASTFAAILDACRLLQTRQVDLMVAGASDRTMDPATFAKFSAIGALSATHSTPFDSQANGFVMGEGSGALTLKRLSDAIHDGDKIQAVIRGVGASSDGRGKGITAPSTRGQIQAVSRAYMQAGYESATVELIEAHGTSTVVGDATELTSLSSAFSNTPSGQTVAVGSIKSQIGHLKAAAGIAGLIKAIRAVDTATIPPSAGFSTPNANVDWSTNPFYVPTEPQPWTTPSGHPRRAGVSSFGFGGTNFHCAIESYDRDYHSLIANEFDARRAAWLNPGQPSSAPLPSTATLSHSELKEIEGGALLLNAPDLESLVLKISLIRSELFTGSNFDDDPYGKRLSIVLPEASKDYVAEGVRCAIVASNWAQLSKRFDLLEKSIEDRSKWDFLAKQMVMVTDTAPLPKQAKVAHLYPGQGSQYVGMTLDLSKRYRCIGDTWDEADLTMTDVLDGESLSSFVLRENLTEEQKKESEYKLKQTEYTQPAMLAADLALYRLMKEHGLEPDMVAGHSLGEYAALMVAGILDFDSALRAVAARGTEMGGVEVPDCGIMASVSAPYEQIEAVLDAEEGYVIAANKNSPKMTVIAGETEPMKRVMRIFDEAGAPCVQLQTSHAFHSRIVAPANEPLRRFLEGLEINLPQIPITSNFDGGWYPNVALAGSSPKEAILAKLAPQMASAVEWTKQMETMYDGGARLFVEVGPKRALTLFAEQIFEDKPKIVANTNHPKVGGIASFHAALAAHALSGRIPNMPDADSNILTGAFKAGVQASPSTATPQDIRGVSRKIVSTKENNSSQIIEDPEEIERKSKEIAIAKIVSEISGFPLRMIHGSTNLETIGLTESKIYKIHDKIKSNYRVKGTTSAKTLPELVEWMDEVPNVSPPMKPQSHFRENPVAPETTPSRRNDAYVFSGISLGLPGMEEVFAPETFDRIIRGDNFISELSDEIKQRLLDRNLVRIIKHADGSAEFVPCNDFSLIPQLAGRSGHFDLAEQYGVDPKIVEAMDITTSLALAAGLEALKDAGLPLVAVEQVNKAGKRLIQQWHLPESERNRTGVIFASCFPGVDQAMRHAQNNGADEEGHFDRRFLLQILTMGHSQFAQYIGARGPNISINNACASTPSAIAVAEDWLNTGRCDRIIIVSADDSTSDELMTWIGAGFAAAGAHAMGNAVEDVSLPFDARRNGMLLGMGAAGFVIERNSLSVERGVTPYVELLGTHLANSAFHPTRLDVEHVSNSLENFITKMEQDWGLNRHSIASRTSFMSHEPATPPRGGSAAAEIQALRRTFGESASKIIITNTKGFTGHPMGTGIEDSVSIRGLCQGEFPPIANFKQPDPELGDLRLSVGGPVDVEYVVRHAAGFGSQMAFTMVRRIANNLERLDRSRIANWTAKVVGGNTDLRILDRKLVAYINPDEKIIGGVQGEPWAFVESEEPKPELIPPSKPVMIEEVAQVKSPPQPANDVSSKVVEVVVKHTGYPEDFIELDQDLEGELGIDTVKQAEIMAELRDFYNLPVDESFVLSEHPTLNHMIAYLGQDESEPEIEEAIPVEPVTHQLVAEETPVHAEPEKMGVRRWQVEVEESPPEATTPLEIEGRVVAVTDDPWGVADTLCHILEAAGIDTVRIMLDPSIVSKVKIEKDGPVDIIRVDPGNHEQLAEVSAHLAKVGEVVALLHLSPLRLAGVGWETETQQAQLTSTTHGLFGLLKSLDTQLSSIKDGTVMSVSAMDGRHGNASSRFNALAAGAHGIVKSYAKEKPHLRCRAVDIDPELLADPTALAHQIWAEAFGRTSPLEVGLSRDGNRWALRLYEEDLPHEIQSLQSDDVWVVSGGGAGVTARCIVGVAESSRNAGATFILLGRTKLDASIEQWLQDDEEALQKRKMNLREEMIAESESGKVTMVEWDREWNQKIRSFEIHKTILEIQATGNRALYDACDVTNSKSVSKVLTAVRKECGSITGIVHGAGLEDSKLVADKSWEKFNQIISVKIDGWRALIDAIGDDLHQLRTLCAFTSIAGRFGNGGQVDYAAANNILDAEMCRISHHEDAPRAVAIAWSGWRDVGMATRGSLESVFLQAGIETIPVDIGVEIFTHEMLAGGKRRVVAAGALGILDDEDCKRAPPQKFPADTAGALSEPERFPFVDRILEHDQYAEILTECTLSTDRFPFLVDHSIAGTPYHPGVMAMEMFAQSSLLLYPMCILEGFSEIKFGLPIKLIKEETRIRVRAKYFDQDHNSLFIKCHIESDLVNSNGEIFGEPRIHHEGIVRLLKEGASRDSEVAFSDSPGRGKASFQPNFIYDRFFHGPRFQVHGGMIKGVSDGDDLGVDGIALLRNQLPNSQLFDQEPALLESLPMLIEACFQNAGMVAMEVDGISSLPIGIEECEVLKVPATRDELRVRSYRRAEEEGGVTVHDAMVFDRNQKPIVSLKGLRLKGMAPVPEELQFSLKRKGK